MFTTIITDCKGENEAGRQIARFNSYGLGPTNLIGVGNSLDFNATIEAAGNLIDILDATEASGPESHRPGGGNKGVVIVNVAPRGDKKKDGDNGSSFAYFYYKDTLIISTVKGYCLSLVKKFGIAKKINVLNTKQVLNWAVENKLINKKRADYITRSQFRSFDFAPFVAKWLIKRHELPSHSQLLSTIYQLPNCVWHIDAFGNCKTTLLKNDLPLKEAPLKVRTNLGEFYYFERLKDIPKGETAIYNGSSGLGNKRFIEIATQGIPESAAKKLNIIIGDKFEIM